jgi:hypothetical protein
VLVIGFTPKLIHKKRICILILFGHPCCCHFETFGIKLLLPFYLFKDFEIDPEGDTDQVDDLLAACVKQAMQQQE